MQLTFLKGVVLGSVVAVVTLTATSAVAGTGVGAVFNLGKTNSVNATSHLTGTASGPMLGVKNKGTGAALSISVGKGATPFTVNSTTRVANLNASLLGGLGPNNFVRGGGVARAYALTLTGVQANVPLLSIPGFGSIRASCKKIAGGISTAIYGNGPRTVDLWATRSDTTPAASLRSDVPPFKNSVIGGALDGDTLSIRLMIHYTTRSGLFFFQHVATVDLAVSRVGQKCKFVAEALAGTGQLLP